MNEERVKAARQLIHARYQEQHQVVPLENDYHEHAGHMLYALSELVACFCLNACEAAQYLYDYRMTLWDEQRKEKQR